MATNPRRPEPTSLLQRLYDPGVARRDIAGWHEGLLRLLAEIRDSGEAHILPHILVLIDDEDRAVANAAGSAIGGLLARLTPAEVANLDSIVRDLSIYSSSNQFGWYRLSPEGLDRQLDSGGLPSAFVGLASMHHSGYVRAAALRRLAESQDGSEVPYLLLRVNDWVSPVRDAARAALWERLQPEYALHFVRNLPLVTRLSRCGRDNHSAFVASVFDRLRDPASRPALLEGLSSTDREVRRTCFALVIEAPDIALREFLGGVLRHDDPILRLRAAQTARSRLAQDDYLTLMRGMMGDRFMPVRREALVGLVERCPDLSRPALMTSLLDPHASIREVARHHLEKSGGFDARSFYCTVILAGNNDHLPEAIAGLGETGTREDAGVVGRWLTDPATRVRRASVRAVGRLDGDSRVGDLLLALEDDRPSVSRLAREALRVRLSLVACGRLWEVFQRDHHPHARRNALALLTGLGKWATLPYLIRACHDDDPEIASLARSHLRDWVDHFNRSFARPSSDDLGLAVVALEASASTLEPEIVRLLRFHLGGW
jgi:HEAT repeat protein